MTSKTMLYGWFVLTLSLAGVVGVPWAAGKTAGLKPVLLLSVNRGTSGTRVQIKGINCGPLLRQRDELTWHDSYEVAHRDSGYRKVGGLHRKRYTITATFTVSPRDHRGWGVLDLFCGSPSVGNAVARFFVTR